MKQSRRFFNNRKLRRLQASNLTKSLRRRRQSHSFFKEEAAENTAA